jgi:hypothetical protein
MPKLCSLARFQIVCSMRTWSESSVLTTCCCSCCCCETAMLLLWLLLLLLLLLRLLCYTMTEWRQLRGSNARLPSVAAAVQAVAASAARCPGPGLLLQWLLPCWLLLLFLLQLLLLSAMHLMQRLRQLPCRRCASAPAMRAQQLPYIDGLPANKVLIRLSMFALICPAISQLIVHASVIPGQLMHCELLTWQ